MTTDTTKKLDTNWIEEFEKIDNPYEIFYKEDVSFVSVRYIYIDSSNEIQSIKEEVVFLKSPNILSRDELIGILKHRSFLNTTRYTVMSILKYNIHLESKDVQYFLAADRPISYLSLIKHIDSIHFEKTITMFQDMNEIIIIFNEKSASINQNQTKRILYSTHKKTLRKMT
uniref:Uncharacterized protein n=1 Tax=viral metagenome TaxID=1070528 RepID=A0A6C0BCA8_9ZZZZ